MRGWRKYIFANSGLKLLALAISFLLWSTYSAEPFVEIGFQVPLEFTSIPPELEISGEVPTQVHVRIRGRSAILRRLSAADLNVRVDLQDAKEGVSLVRITTEQVGVPFGARVVGIAPTNFPVTLVLRHSAPPPTS
jgi:hypothetical protein